MLAVKKRPAQWHGNNSRASYSSATTLNDVGRWPDLATFGLTNNRPHKISSLLLTLAHCVR
jgi:hypothetical protein